MKAITVLIFSCMMLVFSSPLYAQNSFSNGQPKNVGDARSKAVAGTIFPIAIGVAGASLIKNNTIQKMASYLAVYGLVMGPSMGNFYAKDYLRGMLGVAARLAGGYLIKNATRELAGKGVAKGVGWDNKSVSLTSTKILVGEGIILGSAIYNIISSKASVHRYNRKVGYQIGMGSTYRHGKLVPMLSARFRF